MLRLHAQHLLGRHRPAPDDVGFARRCQLWSRQIDFQKFVGDQQPAIGGAIRQVMAEGPAESRSFTPSVCPRHRDGGAAAS
jgi:hypothetical protein